MIQIKVKQVVVVFLYVSSVFLLVSCRKEEADKETSAVPAKPSQEQTADASKETSKEVLVVTPKVGIGPVQFGMSNEEVVQHLGEPEQVMNDGRSLMYLSKGFSLGVSPTKGVFTINCYTKKVVPSNLSANDFQGKTDAGIAMGSNQAQIVEAYGEPDRETDMGKQKELHYDELGIRFILLKDRLLQFFVNRPRS